MLKIFNKYLSVIAAISFFAILIYAFVRLYYFTAAELTPINYAFALVLLIAEAYMILHSLGFIINVFRIRGKKFYSKVEPIKEADQPSVAVIVPAKNEPKEVLFETLVTLRSLDYKNKTVYLLDDSDKPEFIKQSEQIAEALDVKIFRRKNAWHGAKAGIVNDFLKEMKEEYLAIFDADQSPAPDFLQKTIPLSEKDEKIAFVQTPQFYSNFRVSPITEASAMQQAVFYESICEGKGTVNAMFCCGTNVIIRKKALEDVGGFDEEFVTEDFATSVKFHLKGWKSIYYNHVRVFGMGPETLPAYFKQQFRWASGTTGVLRKIIKAFFRNPTGLTASQWWEYFLSGSYYLIGWTFLALVLCPAFYLIFNIPTFFISPGVYLATYIPYFFMTFSVFYTTMLRRHYRPVDIYRGVIMGSLMFPVFISASVNGLLGLKTKFVITPKGKSGKVPFLQLWPWHLTIFFNVIGLYFGIVKFDNNPYAIGINIFWACYHIFIMGHIYFFNQQPQVETLSLSEQLSE